MKPLLLLLATSLLLFAPAAFAQTKVPGLINYQGNVRNAAGVALGSGTAISRTVTFRFYKAATSVLAADRLWSESQTVTILDGNFNVLLGAGTAVSGETNAVTPFANVFSQSAVLYLGITVDDGNSATTDAEISPRQQLVTGAYAFRATVAESVDSTAITTAMLASGAVTTNQLGAAAVTTAKIAADAVTNAQILNGTIGVDELGIGAVTSDKILDGTITSADIATDTIAAGDIAAGGVASSEILDGSIVTADLADNAVTAGKIVDGTIATADIADSSITSAKIADGTVTGTDLGANTATTAENLRIVRGTISIATGFSTAHTGLSVTGSGFSYTLNSTFVQITFNPPFSATPTITVSNHSHSAWTQYVEKNTVDFPTASQFKTSCSVSGISSNGDTLYAGHGNGLEFIAIGPR